MKIKVTLNGRAHFQPIGIHPTYVDIGILDDSGKQTGPSMRIWLIIEEGNRVAYITKYLDKYKITRKRGTSQKDIDRWASQGKYTYYDGDDHSDDE